MAPPLQCTDEARACVFGSVVRSCERASSVRILKKRNLAVIEFANPGMSRGDVGRDRFSVALILEDGGPTVNTKIGQSLTKSIHTSVLANFFALVGRRKIDSRGMSLNGQALPRGITDDLKEHPGRAGLLRTWIRPAWRPNGLPGLRRSLFVLMGTDVGQIVWNIIHK